MIVTIVTVVIIVIIVIVAIMEIIVMLKRHIKMTMHQFFLCWKVSHSRETYSKSINYVQV